MKSERCQSGRENTSFLDVEMKYKRRVRALQSQVESLKLEQREWFEALDVMFGSHCSSASNYGLPTGILEFAETVVLELLATSKDSADFGVCFLLPSPLEQIFGSLSFVLRYSATASGVGFVSTNRNTYLHKKATAEDEVAQWLFSPILGAQYYSIQPGERIGFGPKIKASEMQLLTAAVRTYSRLQRNGSVDTSVGISSSAVRMASIAIAKIHSGLESKSFGLIVDNLDISVSPPDEDRETETIHVQMNSIWYENVYYQKICFELSAIPNREDQDVLSIFSRTMSLAFIASLDDAIPFSLWPPANVSASGSKLELRFDVLKRNFSLGDGEALTAKDILFLDHVLRYLADEFQARYEVNHHDYLYRWSKLIHSSMDVYSAVKLSLLDGSF